MAVRFFGALLAELNRHVVKPTCQDPQSGRQARVTDRNRQINPQTQWFSSAMSEPYPAAGETKTLSLHRPHRIATLLVVLILAVFLFCVGWAVCSVERRLVLSAGHSLVQAATDAGNKLELMIAERAADIEVLASSPVLLGNDRAALTSYLNRLLKSYRAYQWIGVTDARGRFIAGTDSGGLSRDRTRTQWFQLATKSDGVMILDAKMNSEVKHSPGIIVTAPIRSSDGRFHGAVAALVEVPSLVDLLDQTMRVLQGAAWSEDSHIEYQLLNAKGDLIADSGFHQEGHLNLRDLGLPSAQMVVSSERGFVEETHQRRHEPVVTAYSQVTISQAHPPLRWGILIRVNRDSVLAPIRTFLQKIMLLTTLIVVPVTVLLLWLVKQLHHEWHLAAQESARASEAEAALSIRAETLHALVEAAKHMAAAPDLDALLLQVLESARATTGARHAAVGIFDETKITLDRFVTIESDDAMIRAIGMLPVESELLAHLAQKEGVIRIDHLAGHLGPQEFERGYPPPSSFLGISLRCHGQLFGQLYLADKVSHNGTVTAFTELDEQVLQTLSSQAGVLIDNLQLLHDSKEQALHDSLTGLLNHSAILDALNRELARAQRDHEPLAVLMADLDHFKRINDTYGHRVGDVVIREAARRIQEAARRYDLVGRVGGEEFLIILPGCDDVSAAEIAERIRFMIGGDPIESHAGPLSITISIGVATWTNDIPALPHLLWETADQALYRVKQNGRNGIEFAVLPPIAPREHAA
jgi:diguanylate cyclase (GGDEF)-like protein